MAKNDLSDGQKVGRKALEERMARRQELSDVGWLMSAKEGRRFMWRFLRAGNIFGMCFTGNNSSFYNEGRREVMLPFLADSQRYPDLYIQMVRENTPAEEPPKVRENEEETAEA